MNDAQRTGRFYTPQRLAELVLALAMPDRSREVRLWDPTCGDGSFLRAAARAGMPAGSMTGTDLDRSALDTLARALPGAKLRGADLFELTPQDLGPFEVIVGNPPFLRVERVKPAARRRMRERLAERIGQPVPGSADVSLIALAWCLGFLAPGGRLAFVLPSTALDVASGASLRAWIASNHHVELVFDSMAEPWFLDAAVNTVVVVLRRADPGPVRLARVRTATDAKLAPALRGDVEDAGVTARTVPPSALRANTWSPLLRAPPVWFDVLERAGDRLVPLGDRLDLSYGTKPGISSFFAARPPPDVEPAFLVPFLRTLRHQHRYRVAAEHTDDALFVVPRGKEPGPRAQAWIDAGAARTSTRGTPLPQVPSVKTNSPWWRLPQPRSGPVLVPQFRSERHHIIDNPELLLVNNSAWHGTWREPRWRQVGIALLNSTLLALGAEVLGRTNLGEGLLTLYGPELSALPMPDPARLPPEAVSEVLRAWRSISSRPVLPLFDEVLQTDRADLDAAVLAGIGLPAELTRPIAEGAVALMSARQDLARKRRSG